MAEGGEGEHGGWGEEAVERVAEGVRLGILELMGRSGLVFRCSDVIGVGRSCSCLSFPCLVG